MKLTIVFRCIGCGKKEVEDCSQQINAATESLELEYKEPATQFQQLAAYIKDRVDNIKSIVVNTDYIPLKRCHGNSRAIYSSPLEDKNICQLPCHVFDKSKTDSEVKFINEYILNVHSRLYDLVTNDKRNKFDLGFY